MGSYAQASSYGPGSNGPNDGDYQESPLSTNGNYGGSGSSSG